MFYSRPDIEPLGWDLKGLPVEDGSRNHLAVTTEGKIVGFRFSSGWLGVRYSNPDGTSNYFQMDKVLLEKQIAPFGTTDIFPEQLCHILGLTVKGEKISYPFAKLEEARKGAAHYIDLSGQTTYWWSEHRFMPRNDATAFIDLILSKFPAAALCQYRRDSEFKNPELRHIDFLLDEDRHVVIALGGSPDLLEKAKQNPKHLNEFFPLLIYFRKTMVPGWDHTGKQLLLEKHGSEARNLDFHTINVERYSLQAEFKTEDEFCADAMFVIQRLLVDYFNKKLKVYNLQDKSFIRPLPDDITDTSSYSKNLTEWLLEKNNRYLYVGWESSTSPVFIGHRP